MGWCSMEFVNPPEELDRLSRRAFARPVQISRGPACEIARRIACEMRIRDDLSSLSLWGLGIELLTTIARGDDPPRQESNPVWLGRVIDLLRARCCDALSVRELALEAGVHPGHLARAFRRARGCRIGEFLRGERIERAKSLLVRSDESIALIAARVGFSDQAHLTRAFKRETGTTPAVYRASARWR
ncbi:MAG TPA: AraC family transcriptional regulator [Phycisphaerae bacterium]|nr:AraC family transcriptional regulator [Phycisphaerae bacterium]